MLKIGSGVDEERAAFRFGAAFLAPAPSLIAEVGAKRAMIHPEELLVSRLDQDLSCWSCPLTGQHLFGRMLQSCHVQRTFVFGAP